MVIGIVTHYNSFLMDVRLAGVPESLHLTDRHRVFSATRHDSCLTIALVPMSSDRWFLVQIKEIVDIEEELAGARN